MLRETQPENVLENARRYNAALMPIGLSHYWWQVEKKRKGQSATWGRMLTLRDPNMAKRGN